MTPRVSTDRTFAMAVIALALTATSACARQKPLPEEKIELPAELESKELDELPKTATRANINYEGKVRLVGYELDEKGPVRPGQRIPITLYWQRTGKLDNGLGRAPAVTPWQLFTHVLDHKGRKIANPDNDGPFRKVVSDARWGKRQAFPPSAWKRGKIYVDEQTIEIPRKLFTPTVIVTTGVWRYYPVPASGDAGPQRSDKRLQIFGAGSDGHNRGIVAELPTTWKPPEKPAEEPKTDS